ncbi:hypothetical protein SCARD494_08933 [Seiridium cardinale]
MRATAQSMSRYVDSHEQPNGVGDARPIALQVVNDEGRVDGLRNKVILITGASAGIGIETARAMAATGARVVLAAWSDFLEPGWVELIKCDMSSLSSVREAAEVFLAKSQTLNIMICNAGVMAIPQSKLSVYGHRCCSALLRALQPLRELVVLSPTLLGRFGHVFLEFGQDPTWHDAERMESSGAAMSVNVVCRVYLGQLALFVCLAGIVCVVCSEIEVVELDLGGVVSTASDLNQARVELWR